MITKKGVKVSNLTKHIGGFGVGCSPEGLIALGMVRFQQSKYSDHYTEINSGKYTLKLFTDGRSINTFYPEFTGLR